MTAAPADSIVPAKSAPKRDDLGPRSPVMGRAIQGVPVRVYQSKRLTDAARTRTSTSSSSGCGASIIADSITSGEPYRSRIIAFIVIPASLVVRCKFTA